MVSLLRTGLCFILFLLSIISFAQTSRQSAQVWDTKKSLGFTENKGQLTDENGNLRTDVKYIYTAPGFKAVFKANSFSYEFYTINKSPGQISESTGKPEISTQDENILTPENFTVKTHRVDIELKGANQHGEIIAAGKSANYSNYYLAHTPESGVQKVYNYARLTYKNAWPQIDIVFYAKKEGELKYDIILHPGAKLSDVEFAYHGAGQVKLAEGKLNIQTSLGRIEESIPLSYTLQDKKTVDINYNKQSNIVSFTGKHNPTKTLVIDPVIKWWSTFFGGQDSDHGAAVSTDDSGYVYLTGSAESVNNISTSGAYQTTYSGGLYDVFVAKFSANGKRLWATYYGGSGEDGSSDILCFGKSNIYISGSTHSSSGIATSGSYKSTYGGLIDGFMAKFNNNGALQWGTYFGGSEQDQGGPLTNDASGNIFMVGYSESTSNIATTGALKTTNSGSGDAYLVKFNAAGKRQWATYYGGSAHENALDVVCDTAGNIYMVGGTHSISGISSSGFQTNNAGDLDGFLVKFDKTGARQWATYFGGTKVDNLYSVACDAAGNVYAVGSAESKGLGTSGTHQVAHQAMFDVILIKVTSYGSRAWVSYFGGAYDDKGFDITIDKNDNIYIAGKTQSTTNIASPGAQQTTVSSIHPDAFLAKFNTNGIRQWSTYYGGASSESASGVRCDKWGNVYMTGNTYSSDFLTTPGTHQPVSAGAGEAFIVKYVHSGLVIDSFSNLPATICSKDSFRLTAVLENLYPQSDSSIQVNAIFYGPDTIASSANLSAIKANVKQSISFSPWIKLVKPGNYKVNAYISSAKNTFSADTLFASVQVYEFAKPAFDMVYSCADSGFLFTNTSVSCQGFSSYKWYFGDGQESVQKNPLHKYASAGTYQVTLVVYAANGKDSVIKTLVYDGGPVTDFSANAVYGSTKVSFTNDHPDSTGKVSAYLWDFGDGDTSTALHPTHTYDTAGNYKVTLTVSGKNICSKSVSKVIQLIAGAKAAFSHDTICANTNTIFTNTSSIISDSLATYYWDFGDGNSSILKNPVHTFDSAGTYVVALKIRSGTGCTDSISQTIVVNSLPVAGFKINNVCLRDSAYFTDSSISAAEYIWDFGDNTFSTQKNPAHKYFSAGTYMVKLKVKNQSGCMDSITRQVEIYDLPQAVFSADTICVSDSFRFTSQGSGATAWFWKFGDDATSTEENPKYKYTFTGQYKVWLIVTNAKGCKDSVMHTITVDSACVWPGDANADKVVDNKDILAIGIAYGDTGFTRTDTSTIWKGHRVKNWSNAFLSGQNYKHADSDGDGNISYSDTLAVTRNYSRTHLKKELKNRGKNTDPVLKIDIANDSLKAGDTLVAYIILGENALPAKNVYGLAFSIAYNKSLFSAPVVDFSNTWLGKDILTYSNTKNGLDIALTRTDHQNISGAGLIAIVRLVVNNNIKADQHTALEISDNILISANENIIPNNLVEDSVAVYRESNSLAENNLLKPELNVYPNPFSSQTILEYYLATNSQVNISLTDVYGKEIVLKPTSYEPSGKHHFILDAAHYNLPGGIYFIKLLCDEKQVYKKVIRVK